LIESEISHGMTAFLDILGFGERVASAKEIDDVAAIAKDVERIQRAFAYATTDTDTKTMQEQAKKTVLAFSDSVIVIVPLESPVTQFQGTFDPFMSEFVDLAVAQAQCVMKGLFLRGGLDLGWWYRNGDVLVSQGLARAYRMEGLANVPVIALTPDLYHFFEEHSDRRTYAKSIEPISNLLRKYSGQSKEGPIDFWFLDYLRIVVGELDWSPTAEQRSEYDQANSERRDQMRDEGYAKAIQDWFFHHARQIELAREKATLPKVIDKFVWLSKYHNEAALEYQLDTPYLCTVV
jgi:hypothetical protein